MYWNWDSLLAPTPASSMLRGLRSGNKVRRIAQEPMTNKGLELTLEIPDSSLLQQQFDRGSTPTIRMPHDCLTDADLPQQQLAIRFTAIRISENGVLRGKRFSNLVIGPVGKLETDEYFGTKGGLATIGSEGPTKTWKVYFPQEGL